MSQILPQNEEKVSELTKMAVRHEINGMKTNIVPESESDELMSTEA